MCTQFSMFIVYIYRAQYSVAIQCFLNWWHDEGAEYQVNWFNLSNDIQACVVMTNCISIVACRWHCVQMEWMCSECVEYAWMRCRTIGVSVLSNRVTILSLKFEYVLVVCGEGRTIQNNLIIFPDLSTCDSILENSRRWRCRESMNGWWTSKIIYFPLHGNNDILVKHVTNQLFRQCIQCAFLWFVSRNKTVNIFNWKWFMDFRYRMKCTICGACVEWSVFCEFTYFFHVLHFWSRVRMADCKRCSDTFVFDCVPGHRQTHNALMQWKTLHTNVIRDASNANWQILK